MTTCIRFLGQLTCDVFKCTVNLTPDPRFFLSLVVRGFIVCSSNGITGGVCLVVETGTRKKQDMSTACCQNNWALNAPPPESSILAQVCAQQQA